MYFLKLSKSNALLLIQASAHKDEAFFECLKGLHDFFKVTQVSTCYYDSEHGIR